MWSYRDKIGDWEFKGLFSVLLVDNVEEKNEYEKWENQHCGETFEDRISSLCSSLSIKWK